VLQAIEVARSYFDAWSSRDAAAVAATFAEGGTCSGPVAGSGLAEVAPAAYAGALFTAFPDLTFDVVSVGPTGDSTVAAEWVMRGTNTFGYAAWAPHHANAMWVRCAACDRTPVAEKQGETSPCGQPLPEPPAYW
jgi:hypothetical protein